MGAGELLLTISTIAYLVLALVYLRKFYRLGKQ